MAKKRRHKGENGIFAVGEIFTTPELHTDADGEEYVHFLLHFPDLGQTYTSMPKNNPNYIDCITYDDDCKNDLLNKLNKEDIVEIGHDLMTRSAHLMSNIDKKEYVSFKSSNCIIFESIRERPSLCAACPIPIELNARIVSSLKKGKIKDGFGYYYFFRVSYSTYPYKRKDDPFKGQNIVNCVIVQPATIFGTTNNLHLRHGDPVRISGQLIYGMEQYGQNSFGIMIDVWDIKEEDYL